MSDNDPSPLDRLINGRRSIRRYTDAMPDAEWIEKMIYSAGRAPSPSNSQPVRFVLIKSKRIRDDIQHAMASGKDRLIQDLESRGGSKRVRNWINAYYRFSEFMFHAPMLFAVGITASPGGLSEKLAEAGILKQPDSKQTDLDITVGLALKGFILKGQELGLGSCILTAPLVFIPDIDAILETRDIHIKCFVTVGFADEKPGFLEKRGVSHIYGEI